MAKLSSNKNNKPSDEAKSDNNYYNSKGFDPDIIYNYLARGLRTPQNEEEEKWAEGGKRLLAKGGYEMYFD